MSKRLNSKTKDVLIQRIMLLQPGATPLWGRFTVEEMMFHYTKVTNNILSGKPSPAKPTMKQRITKMMGLYLMKNFPKGIQSGPKYVKAETDILLFDKERQALIDVVNKAAAHTEPINGTHPFFGPLHTKEWRIFLWKHLDHHLRQFGVGK